MNDPRFASDNAAGVHPAVLQALADANRGAALAYGHDAITERAVAAVRRELGEQAEVLFVWGGTAANVVGLRAVVDSFHAVLCGEQSHLWSDECAAPEKFLGCKLQPLPTCDGKVRPDDVLACLGNKGVVHHAQPRVVSIAQSTEVGTVYSVAELRALAEVCRQNDLLLHVDGARLANAAVHLNVDLRAVSTDVGVDVLSLGGTKNGLLGAEAVVFLRPELAPAAQFHRKQSMQLASKMRFVAAQVEALLTDGLWRDNARRANAMAQRLAAGAAREGQVEVAYPVEGNAVFARLPRATLVRLRDRFAFHVWRDDPQRPLVRWMTAFDTSEADVAEFLAALRDSASQPALPESALDQS